MCVWLGQVQLRIAFAHSTHVYIGIWLSIITIEDFIVLYVCLRNDAQSYDTSLILLQNYSI